MAEHDELGIWGERVGGDMSDLMNNWNHKETWSKRGDTFCVEVSHHESTNFHRSEGPNRWCVYAYIYPTHPHFKKFKGDDMWQEAAMDLPLHGGPTLLCWHYIASTDPISVQVGADYHHDGDSFYTFLDDADAARSVFLDAEKLFAWLETAGAGEI